MFCGNVSVLTEICRQTHPSPLPQNILVVRALTWDVRDNAEIPALHQTNWDFNLWFLAPKVNQSFSPGVGVVSLCINFSIFIL